MDGPDGVNYFIFGLADELVGRGHDVSVVTALECDVEKVREMFRLRHTVPIISLTEHTKPGVQRERLKVWAGRGRRQVRALRPDLVIINGTLPLRLSDNDATVLHDCCDWHLGQQPLVSRSLHRWARALGRFLGYHLSRHLICTCGEISEVVGREVPFTARKCKVIPIGTRMQEVVAVSERERLLVHIGTASHKNPLPTLRAFAKMETPDVRLAFMGGPSAELEAAVSKLAPEIRSRVTLTDFLPRSEFLSLLQRARVVSIPSDYPVAVCSPSALESLAVGTPVVCSESISQDVVPEGVCGFRVKLTNYETEAARHLDDLFGDDVLWQTMSRHAQRHSARFSFDEVSSCYERLLPGMVAKEEGPAVATVGGS